MILKNGKRVKTYNIVKKLLEKHPELRDSDKELIWTLLELQGKVYEGRVSKKGFLSAVSAESVTRARRKVQEKYPELQSSEWIQRRREEKEKEKGNFVYREEVLIFDENENTVRKVYREKV